MTFSALLLPDSGPRIGMGHVGRCTALGQALAARGWHVVLVAADPVARRFARSSGIRTALRPSGRWDVAIVDTYRTPLAATRRVHRSASRIAAIDDLHQMTSADVDLIVRPSIGEHSGPGVLGGSRYVLLRREYWHGRPRPSRPRLANALVALGAYPAPGEIERLRAIVRATLPHAHVDAAVGVSAGRLGDLAPKLAAADVAIVSGGQTLNEALAAGVPALVVRTFANQKRQIGAAVRASAALPLETLASPRLPATLRRELIRLETMPRERRRLRSRGRALVDGQGALRAAQALERLMYAER